MSKEFFESNNFTKARLSQIATINAILADYDRQGYDLSLRQLYYQLVRRNIIPNSVQEYKKLVDLMGKARLAGLVDWSMITDRGRSRIVNTHWKDPGEIIEAAVRSYHVDHWEGQPWHVEVMVEKQALEGVLAPVCRRLDVAFSANKGYTSLSMLYWLGKRLGMEHNNSGKNIRVIYLGDHDPSGIDMTRDIEDRLRMFSGVDIDVKRIALNMNQVEHYQLPENPAKITDSRYDRYVDEYGPSSWELDAIEPAELARMVEEAVLEVRDDPTYMNVKRREQSERAILRRFQNSWQELQADEDDAEFDEDDELDEDDDE